MAQCAIVLQGGGALGAYEFGALKRLAGDADFQPEIISGVSIGAVNAAMLVGARGDPIDDLERLWDRFAVISPPLVPDFAEQFLSLYGNLSFFRMRGDYFNMLNWTSFYSIEPLKRELNEFIDFDKLNHSPTRLLLTATDIETGTLAVFDNHDQTTFGPITADHILAGCSLPPGFPITRIDDAAYWDGGLFNNTPLAPLIERLDPKRKPRLYVINVFPSAGRVPTNMMGVLDRVFEIIFSNRLTGDVATLKKINDFVEAVDAIDRALPRHSEVRRLPGFDRLKQYRLIKDLVLIENTDAELASAPFDFSRKSLTRRIEAGYRDADARLRDR